MDSTLYLCVCSGDYSAECSLGCIQYCDVLITGLGVNVVASDAETCCLLLKHIDSVMSFEKQQVVRQIMGSNFLILFLH
jgi:hypothetical protein